MEKAGIKKTLIIKTLIFIVLVPGSVTVIIPYLILKDSLSTVLQFSLPYCFGLFPAFLGLIICFWCFADFINKGAGTPSPFDPPRQLVVEGLYRYVRNPMYIGINMVVFGWAVVTGNPWNYFYALIVPIIFHLRVVLYEEKEMQRLFNRQWDHYKRSVPRWGLRFKRYQSEVEQSGSSSD